jgi:phage terminase small subunit
MNTRADLPKPPRGLRRATRAWWLSVVETYQLEDHHVRLLTLAAESWDRAQEARDAIRKHGLTYEDPKLRRPVARPEVAIERDSQIRFARLLRELDLDVEAPAPERSRPPALRSVGTSGRR